VICGVTFCFTAILAMEPQSIKHKGENHSFRDLKRLKKDKKKWKEEKLLKIMDVGSVSPKCTDTKNETEITRMCTFSIAVPGSILDNAQSPELRTYLAGQIARAACVFKVDEVRFNKNTFNFTLLEIVQAFSLGVYLHVQSYLPFLNY
jgi:hypothetical protein